MQRINDYTQSGNRRFYVAYYNVQQKDGIGQRFSGAGICEPFQLVHEKSTNSVYIAGYNTGNEQWNNGGFSSNPAGTWAGFVVKYADDGNFLWGRAQEAPVPTWFELWRILQQHRHPSIRWNCCWW